MTNTRSIFLIWMLSAVPLWAIDVGTSVASISHEGSSQTVGSFTLTLNDDDLATATTQNPIYIRFGLSQSRGWARTLVDLSQDDGVAINLAIYAKGEGLLSPNIPADAIQLIRLVEGESYAWIKVTYSSNLWMLTDDGIKGPSSSNPASIAVGISANSSVQDSGHTPSGGNEFADSHELASTRLRANYYNTPNFGFGDLETISFIAFDSDTTGVEDGFPVLGNNLGIGFSNDFIVGRAVSYYPCLEFHFTPDDFESQTSEVTVTELDLVMRRTFNVTVPGVYLTNSSDFDWEAGTVLYLVQQGFEPRYEELGETPPAHYDPVPGPTHLIPSSSVTVSEVEDGAVWTISEVHWNGELMGYKLVLTEGKMTAFKPILLSGMKVFTLSDYNEEEPLDMAAYCYWTAQGVGQPGDTPQIGPLRRTALKMKNAHAPESVVLPYTGYDRDDLDFEAHVVNTSDSPSRVTAIIRHPVGLMMLVLGEKVLAPNEKWSLPFKQWPEYKSRYGWIAFYGEQELSASGVLQSKDGSVYDIFVNPDRFSDTLYGPHLPTDTASWQTSAYMVSPDPEQDPTVLYRLPGDEPQRVDEGFIIPSGTGVLDDTDFTGQAGRGAWFELDAGDGAVAGTMLYYRTVDSPFMASLPMPGSPETLWRFDHVANPVNGWWNGLVVTNPNDEPVNILVRGLDDSGNEQASHQFQVASEERFRDIVQNFFENSTSVARIEVTSDLPILSFLLMGRNEANRLTTIPGNLPKGQDLFLPHLPSLEEFWAGLAILNDQNEVQEVTITAYDNGGNITGTAQLTAQPGSRTLTTLDAFIGQNPSHLRLTSNAPVSVYGLTGDLKNEQLATLQFLLVE